MHTKLHVTPVYEHAGSLWGKIGEINKNLLCMDQPRTVPINALISGMENLWDKNLIFLSFKLVLNKKCTMPMLS